MASMWGCCKFPKLLNASASVLVSNTGCSQNLPFLTLVRTTKHWNPKFKWERRKKFHPVHLPHLETNNKADNFRRLKEIGIVPPRFWKVRPMTITGTTDIFDPFKPSEGDGKTSLFSKNYAKEITSSLTNKKDSVMAIRKIKSYDSSFNVKIFPQEAQDIYIKAHTVLMKRDPEELSEFVTEKANQEMMTGLSNKTLRWKFIKSLEPPIVVHTRVNPVITKDNFFAQVTVRFHTKQSLAIYDCFGRLFYGSEILSKDVLEYVVFEKHIVNEYGIWRLHGKIIPDWMSSSEPSARTFIIKNEEEEKEEEDELEDLMAPEEEEDLTNIADSEVVKQDIVDKPGK